MEPNLSNRELFIIALCVQSVGFLVMSLYLFIGLQIKAQDLRKRAREIASAKRLIQMAQQAQQSQTIPFGKKKK